MTLELLATNYGNGNGCTCINDTYDDSYAQLY